MSRKPQAVQQPLLAPTLPPLVTFSRPQGVMLAWLAALFAARWLMPTEGATEGLTLWLVQLVLLTAVARTAWEWRFAERPFRFDAMDGAIALLIVAQVVSALLVVFGIGNSRAAINVAWEWVGSGVLIWLLRQELTSLRVLRELCLGLSLAAGVLAGFGLWQHYVGNRETSREYDRLVSDHDRLAERLRGDGKSSVSVSAADVRKLEALRAEMARQQIPIEKSARQSLELRLKASSEPLGLFALANSFAGLLVVMGLIVVGVMARERSARIAVVLWGTLIAYCLLLTKSRTAMVGLFAGIGWWLLRWVFASRRQSEGSNRNAVWPRVGAWAIVGVCVVGGAIGVAALSGGWDHAVLSEATKSLRYRLEWWQGTWVTIREHFWFGTGPGNFRDYYLAHKLPESSEEIADPHNWIFDVWANAGTFGLIGMLSCVGLMVAQVFNQPGQKRNFGVQVENAPRVTAWLTSAVCGVGLAFPQSAVGMELLGYGTDERLWWLGGIWWGLWLIGVLVTHRGSAERTSESGGIRNAAICWSLEAANVALLVHLLGAGGIAMPAITQLLWLVWSLRVTCSRSLATVQEEKSPSGPVSAGVCLGRLPAGVLAFAAGGLCALCWWTATMPEMLCRTSLQIGDAEWGRGQLAAANKLYLDARRADPYAIEPLERLANVALRRWQATRFEHDFDEAVTHQQAVVSRLPFASHPFRRLGQLWMARFEHSRNEQHAARAAAAYALAVERYPHHARLLSELASSSEQAGLIEQARKAARRAVQQDELNRRAGHSDKFLEDQTRRGMDRLAVESAEPN